VPAVRFEEYVPLEPGDGAWRLLVPMHLCSGLRTLWGGAGLAAAVHVAQTASGRPCAWATVQYVRPVHPDDVLELRVDEHAGRSLSQAQVTGTVDGDVALRALVALGGGGGVERQYVSPPDDVPPPEDCEPREMPLAADPEGTFLQEFEQRWAQAPRALRTDGVPGTGRTRVWVRLRAEVETSAGAVALLADLAPSAIGEALGERAGGVSLDNTIRYGRRVELPPSSWLLLDLTVDAVVADVAQLSARLFSPDGALLAVAAQSALVRRRAAPRARRTPSA
jgi:acyl-CoA thioesterase